MICFYGVSLNPTDDFIVKKQAEGFILFTDNIVVFSIKAHLFRWMIG